MRSSRSIYFLFPNLSRRLSRIVFVLIVGVLLVCISSCTATHFLKEDQTFYTEAKIKTTSTTKTRLPKEVKNDLETFLSPKPNGTFLGSRMSVWFYFIAGDVKKEKGFRYFVKNKLGSPPVLLKDVKVDEITSTLENQIGNEGFFGSEVDNEIVTHRKESKVLYNVNLEPAYRLGEIKFETTDSSHSDLMRRFREESTLKSEQRYRLVRLQAEQERMEGVAKNNGYYFFDNQYLLFEADSTVGDHHVDLSLTFEPRIPTEAFRKYTVRHVSVFPDYSLEQDSLRNKKDTLLVDGFQYIHGRNDFRPKVITNVINLRPDSIYRKINYDYTLSRLMSLKTFKFVNIKISEDHNDPAGLNASIYLTPLLKKSIRLQVQGVSKSNNFVGPGVEMVFTNRNFLGGAEMFQIKVNGAYESQISRQQSGALNAIEFGTEASLSVPHFITPIYIPNRSAKYLPQTQMKAAFNLQQRLQYFKLTSINLGFGYTWRETTFKTHELFPIDLSFVKLSNTSAVFDEFLDNNPALSNSFQQQFIPGLHYAFTLNTQLKEEIIESYEVRRGHRHDFYFNFSADQAGNIIYGAQSLMKKQNPPYEILGSTYSQFVIGQIDFRYYWQADRHDKIATRFALGIGYPYGNSTQLPYIKQFAVGGSNSLRAFPARSLGPGTYNVRTDPNVTGDTYFIDQRGDIKLEANVEYRFDIFRSLKGAFFFDSGNIWLRQEDEARPGGKFDKSRFLNEVAVGTGLGVRYDFDFFILRFDLAFPVRKPFYEPGNRWVFDEINLGSSAWRMENLILNIAIGYPF